MNQPLYEARYYQDEAAQALIAYFEKFKGNPIVALPTATGKSLVIPLFMKLALEQWFETRFLVLTHVKELVANNASKMKTVLPHMPYGINCDGLGRRDTMQQVVFGSVGSVVTMMAQIGYRDLIIIDEGHLANDNETSQYSQIVGAARILNPLVKVVCLSATPWTTRGSIITHNDKGECDSLFTHIAYDRTRPEDFAEFISRNWLCPIVAKATNTKYDYNSVGVSKGDYDVKQQQKVTDIDALTRESVAELIHTARMDNRHCGLGFANGIKHAEHIAEELQAQGVTATFVHSKLTKSQRDDRLEGFANAEYQWMINNGILTTGYDHPPIDIIANWRKTGSIPLWVQMVGRGFRPYDWQNPMQYIPGFEYRKNNTLLVDFADNTSTLGPVDDPFFKRKLKKGEPGDAPVKICEAFINDAKTEKCLAYNYASARFCHCCDSEFIFQVKFEANASDNAPMSLGEPISIWHDVTFVNYEKIEKRGMPSMLKVVYHCGFGLSFSELVCLEHKSAAQQYAWGWWKQRSELPMPATVDDALKQTYHLKRSVRIRVEGGPNIKFPKVLEHVF